MTDDSPLPRHLLPPMLLEIIEYTDETTAFTIWRHYGGGHLCVPRSADPLHRLVELLGPERAARFCERFGGDLLSIPRAAEALRAVRNRAIYAARAAGKTQFDIARQFGLTERHVNSILNQAPAPVPDLQLDLFDE